MKNFLFLGCFVLLSINLIAQINMADSTVQVISYWDKNEKQSYTVSQEEYKVNGTDTTERQLINYEVDITVKDSTADSYTIEWRYRNFSTTVKSELMLKILEAGEKLPVLVKTDELGSIIEVINWKEIRDYIEVTIEDILGEFGDKPGVKEAMGPFMNMYTSKASIEANAIKDIRQFHYFHGVEYTLGQQVSGQMQAMNNFGGDPFDLTVNIRLDELIEEDDHAVIMMHQEVDSKQLTDATYEHMKKLGMAGGKLLPRDQFPELTNETDLLTYLSGDTGWVIYSVETKKVVLDGEFKIEERIIEIQ